MSDTVRLPTLDDIAALIRGRRTYMLVDRERAVPHDLVAELCGFAAGTHVLGLVYLGWPTGSPEVPTRPPAAIRFLS